MYERPLTTKFINELHRFCELVGADEIANAHWTSGVKNALRCTGMCFGYEIYATINNNLLPDELQQEYEPPNAGEWLYDVCLSDVSQNNHWHMAVVAECEWGNREFIKEDFEKLLVARACLRVMIYNGSNIGAREFCQWVDLHEGTQAGDTYLLAEYQEREDTQFPFQYRHIVVRTSSSELIEIV